MRLSIITPVLHEQETISSFLAHLQDQNEAFRLAVELILVDGDPAAGTICAINETTNNTQLCRKLSAQFVTAEPGRGKQMNAGAKKATGDYLLFLHADTLLPANGLLHLETAAQSGIEAAAFDLGFLEKGFYFWLTALVGGLRSRFTRKPYGDQALFISRRLFSELGGFRDLPFLEDLEFASRLKQAGVPIKILPKRLKTSARRWQKEGLLRCTLRNWYVAFLFGRGVPPEKLKKYYSFAKS